MALWQQIILVVLIGGIIGLSIAAWVSMRGGTRRGPVARDIGSPGRTPKGQRQPPLLAPGQRLRPMHDRQAELHARLRQRSGHVDTMIVKLPPKDGDEPGAPTLRGIWEL
jgi:hypothetical protein